MAVALTKQIGSQLNEKICVFFLFIFPVLKEKSETLKVVLLKSTGVKCHGVTCSLTPIYYKCEVPASYLLNGTCFTVRLYHFVMSFCILILLLWSAVDLYI